MFVCFAYAGECFYASPGLTVLRSASIVLRKFCPLCYKHVIAMSPCSSRSEVNKFVGPSGAKPREFERKIYIYIYIYVSLKVSVMLPGNSEKQSMNDVRQREGC